MCLHKALKYSEFVQQRASDERVQDDEIVPIFREHNSTRLRPNFGDGDKRHLEHMQIEITIINRTASDNECTHIPGDFDKGVCKF